jgi:hypothetical protein
MWDASGAAEAATGAAGRGPLVGPSGGVPPASDGPTEEVTSCRRTPGLRHLPSAPGVSVADRPLVSAHFGRFGTRLICQVDRCHKIVKMLTGALTAGIMGPPEYLSRKGPCERLQRSPGCADCGRPLADGSPTGGAVVRAGARVVASPATDLATLTSQDGPARLGRGRRPLAALVPSTRSSRPMRAAGTGGRGADGLTICTPRSGPTAGSTARGERIEERRDQ